MQRRRLTIKTLPFRRRREHRTDYRARLALLRSGKPRLVARLTNRRVIAQLVLFAPEGDRTVVQADSKEFERFGWKWKKNTSAAYLTGLLCATRATAAGFKEAVADIGLRTAARGGRLAALIKGAVDGGLAIPFSPEMAPLQERIVGKDAERFSAIKEAILSGKFKKVKEKKKEEMGHLSQK